MEVCELGWGLDHREHGEWAAIWGAKGLDVDLVAGSIEGIALLEGVVLFCWKGEGERGEGQR